MPPKAGERRGGKGKGKGSNKGEAAAVSEADRVHFTSILKSVRDGVEKTEHEFPSTLAATQRAFIHGLATQYGLVSKSKGKGEARAITVSQPRSRAAPTTDDNALPWLPIPPSVQSALARHLTKHPPSAAELAEVERGEAFEPTDNDSNGSSAAAAGQANASGIGDGTSSSNRHRGARSRMARRPEPEKHHAAQAARLQHPSYAHLQAQRKALPAWTYCEQVQRMVRENQVVLISGETGCGKTSQVPQFLLDDPLVGPSCNIVCTQPRRISAISVAERVAAERGESAGGIVGYAVRGDAMENKLANVATPSSGGSSKSAGPWPTQLSFVTPGLLLRRLGSDPTLQRYTHVLIDEVHEQDKYTEFLLVLLKRLLPSRPDLRVVLMSATLRAETFADFFGGCPGLTIGSSMYPVATYFLEDALRNTHFLERRDGVSSADWKQWHASSGGMVEYGDALPVGFEDAEMNQSAKDLELLSSLWRAGGSTSKLEASRTNGGDRSSGGSVKSMPAGPATALAFPLTNRSIEPEVQRQIKSGMPLTAAQAEEPQHHASASSCQQHDSNNGDIKNGTGGGGKSSGSSGGGERFECVVCGSSHFASAEELGAHIAECFGQRPAEQPKDQPLQAASDSSSNKEDAGQQRPAIFSALGLESPSAVPKMANASTTDAHSSTTDSIGSGLSGDGSMAAIMAAAKAAAAQESAAEASAKADIAAALNQYLGGADDEEVDLDLILALLHHIVRVEAAGGPDSADAAGNPGGGTKSNNGSDGNGGSNKGQRNEYESTKGAWQAVPDPEGSGDMYYWNPTTNETTWDLPPDARVAGQPSSAQGAGSQQKRKKKNGSGSDGGGNGHNGSGNEHGAGAILVFLPGWFEISQLRDLLAGDPLFGDARRCLVLPLHSGVPVAEQRRVFQRPPEGVIKIVLATNIAETSLTIDDVAYVVDSGRAKEKGYDPHMKVSVLRSGWISRASAKQRRGRAGRTRRGMCWHLFSKTRHDDALEAFRASELLRTPLEELVLQAKLLGLAPGAGPEDPFSAYGFLASALSPPHPLAVANAVELLVTLGAIGQGNEQLTPLGSLLAALPTEPRLGKMLLWARFLGLGDRAASLCSAMGSRAVFTMPAAAKANHHQGDAAMGATKSKREFAAGSASDQLANLAAVEAYQQFHGSSGNGSSKWRWCEQRCVSGHACGAVVEATKQMQQELRSLPLAPVPGPPTFVELASKAAVAAAAAGNSMGSHSSAALDANALLLALAGSALYPNLGRRMPGESNFSTATGRKCKLAMQTVASHKGPGASVLQRSLAGPCGKSAPDWVAFSDLTQGRTNFMANEVSAVDPLALLLLSAALDLETFGPATLIEENGGAAGAADDGGAESGEVAVAEPYSVLTFDGWVAYRCPPPLALGLATLRRRLRAAFAAHVRAGRAPTSVGGGGCSSGGGGMGESGLLSADLTDAVATAVTVLAAPDGPLASGGGGGCGSFLEGSSSSPAMTYAADWTCPACHANVFASKQHCFRCGVAKPALGATPGPVAILGTGKNGKGNSGMGGKGKGKSARKQ